MKIEIHTEEIYELNKKLANITSQMEEMLSLYSSQTIEDSHFLGTFASSYQQYLTDLSKEHKNMIRLYNELTNELNMVIKDYEELETSLISKIENI